MPNATIVSLALLKVNWDKFQRGYLDNFVPIIAECVRLLPQDIVSLSEVQSKVRSEFGLNMPQNTLETLLRLVKKHGFVKQELNVLKKNSERLAQLNFRPVQIEVLTAYEELVAKLVRFCHESHSVTWTEAEAEGALLAYLQDDKLIIFGSQVAGTTIPPAPAMSMNNRDTRYLVGDFVRYLKEGYSPVFDMFETIVKGNMLANAIFLPDPAEAQRRFRNTAIYFDTKFLIWALGYAGSPREAPCRELLSLLYETGADLRCFAHTVEEIERILNTAGRLLFNQEKATGAMVPMIDHFVAKGYTQSDIELLSVRLPRNLRTLRIEVVGKPSYDPKVFNIDEAALESRFRDTIWYRDDTPLFRDVDSIAAVMRLRQGRAPSLVEECGAIFVTTNTLLAKGCREEFCSTSSNVISPCITDYALTNLVWLKKPMGAPDLPRKRLIADYYAAIQPSDDLWQAYLAEIEKLEALGDVAAEDYYLLRYAIEAKQALMELTNGDRRAFTQATVQEILRLMRDRIAANGRVQLQAEVAHERSLREQAEGNVESANSDEAQRDLRIKARSQNAGHVIARVVEWFLLALVIAGLTLPWIFRYSLDGVAGYVVSGVALVVLVYTLLNLYRGTTIKTTARTIEVYISEQIEKILRKITS